jgi:hypothetical protein
MTMFDFSFPAHWLNTKIGITFKGSVPDAQGRSPGISGVLLYDLPGSVVISGPGGNEVMVPKELIGPCQQVLNESTLSVADAGVLNLLDARRRKLTD